MLDGVIPPSLCAANRCYAQLLCASPARKPETNLCWVARIYSASKFHRFQWQRNMYGYPMSCPPLSMLCRRYSTMLPGCSTVFFSPDKIAVFLYESGTRENALRAGPPLELQAAGRSETRRLTDSDSDSLLLTL
jgi:hypothetical protein